MVTRLFMLFSYPWIQCAAALRGSTEAAGNDDVAEHFEREHAHGDQHFGDAREIVPAVVDAEAGVVADQEAIDAQQHAAKHDRHAGQEQAGRIAPGAGADQQVRQHEAGGFQPEEEGFQRRLQGVAQRITDDQIAETDDQEDAQHAQHDLGQRLQQVHLDLHAVGRRGDAGLEEPP
jgi:hypothetical protein